MGIVPLMVVENEVIEIELVAAFWIHSPVEEGAKGITLHEAIEQPVNLLGSPHKLSLDGRKYEVITLDLIKGLFDSMPGLVHGLLPIASITLFLVKVACVPYILNDRSNSTHWLVRLGIRQAIKVEFPDMGDLRLT